MRCAKKPRTKNLFTYDDWGRTVSKGLGDHLAEYGYGYGDKLKSVTTDIPDEASTNLNYDGLGKLRVMQAAGSSATWLRWDAGYNLLGAYEHGTGALPPKTRRHR